MIRENLEVERLARLADALVGRGAAVERFLEPPEGAEGFMPWIAADDGDHEFLVTVEGGRMVVRGDDGRDASATWKGAYGDLQA